MLMDFVATVTAFIATHPHLAYLAVLLAGAAESTPVVGVVLPGSTVMVALGALVPSGVLTFWPLVAAATAGAVIGDGVSFSIARHYHRVIRNVWPFNRHPALLERGEAFFARHGDKSVFLCRFVPGLRAFVPPVAGMLRMSPRRFYAANVLSAVIWAPAHILLGMGIGAALSQLGAAAKPLAVLIVVLVVLIWIVIHAVRLALRHGIPILSAAAQRLHERANVGGSRWTRTIVNLFDPSRPDAGALAVLALLLIGSAWLFFGILQDVVFGDPLVRADASIYTALQDLRTVPGDAVMVAITELGDSTVVIAVTIAVFLWLVWKRAWRAGAYWLTAIAGASALKTAIKVAVHRARPEELFYTGWSSFSFPSGHSTVNFVLYGFLAFLAGRELSPRWRLPVGLGAMLLALLIAFSRLYLGAHWFSDVIGGLAFGTAWLAALGILYLRKPAKTVGATGLLSVGCAALIVAGGFHVYRSHTVDMARYHVHNVTATMSAEAWWTTGWQKLPARRIDLTGQIREPFTVQYAGKLDTLRQALTHAGWQTPVPWTSSSAMAWLSASVAPSSLPVVPHLAKGKLASLVLTRQNDAGPKRSRFVLRLWAADLQLTSRGNNAPVWVGSVVKEHLVHPLSLFTLAFTQPYMNKPRALLAEELRTARLVARTDVATSVGWDGRVLLIRGSFLE